MAITIQAQLAKKVPIPGADYSSQQASITITAEVTDLKQVVTEAQRLYGLAEQAVDRQLAGHQQAQPDALASATAPSSQPSPAQAARAGAPASPARASQPYRGPQRRSPAPVTDSQLRFITRLIDQSRAPVAGICEQYHIGDLSQLSCRDAAALIDELKLQVPA